MSIYQNHDGQTIQTAQKLAGVARLGLYHRRKRGDLVAKIYHPAQRTAARHAKLTAMVSQPPADPCRAFVPPHHALAWPTDLLFAQDSFVGFLMPCIERSPSIVALFNPLLRAQRFPRADQRLLYRAAQNLAVTVAAIHNTATSSAI
ncbi:MAG: hypothetical protein R2867_21535 [Caldilineaceae bacterium]